MSLPPDEHPPGLVLDARLHLLDRQVLDVDGVPVCTVDDLEVHGVDGSDLPDGYPGRRRHVAAQRRRAGHPDLRRPAAVVALAPHPLDARAPTSAPPWRSACTATSLDVTWTERWVRDHVIGRIPGGRHDPG